MTYDDQCDGDHLVAEYAGDFTGSGMNAAEEFLFGNTKGGAPHIAIGTLVSVRGIPGFAGKICGAMSTLFFPDGIYPVESADANGDPKVSWWHAADLVQKAAT
jgi:hypothetical protein